jgi:hypothetical protein
MLASAVRFVKWNEVRLPSARSTFDGSAHVGLCDGTNAARGAGYCVRIAATGSIRDARSAGTAVATLATATTNSAAFPADTTGSITPSTAWRRASSSS